MLKACKNLLQLHHCVGSSSVLVLFWRVYPKHLQHDFHTPSNGNIIFVQHLGIQLNLVVKKWGVTTAGSGAGPQIQAAVSSPPFDFMEQEGVLH